MVAFIFALPCDYFFVAFCGINYTASGKGKDSVAACFILAGTGSEPLKYRIEKADKKTVLFGQLAPLCFEGEYAYLFTFSHYCFGDLFSQNIFRKPDKEKTTPLGVVLMFFIINFLGDQNNFLGVCESRYLAGYSTSCVDSCHYFVTTFTSA